jgi:hypothetical protein
VVDDDIHADLDALLHARPVELIASQPAASVHLPDGLPHDVPDDVPDVLPVILPEDLLQDASEDLPEPLGGQEPLVQQVAGHAAAPRENDDLDLDFLLDEIAPASAREDAAPAVHSDSPGDARVWPDEAQSSELPAPEPAPEPAATVLGSYRAGGRAYTMYSDGSVEAVTEAGVERFASMEALRAHLADT